MRSNSGGWEDGCNIKKAYEFTVAQCSSVAKYVETFEPDDATSYTWRSTGGGVLSFNESTSPLYGADHDADDKFVLMTKPMIDNDRYLVGNKTNSKSLPTSRSSWTVGKNSPRCHVATGQPGATINIRTSVKLLGNRVKTRSEDTINSPEQKPEHFYGDRLKADYVLARRRRSCSW